MSRSGLVLAGGSVLSPTTAITSGHFATLDLEGTELVTLSACTSGLGASLAGQGVFGLRRAIRLAGARAQLMSLWSVDDRATQHFMAGFYRRWAEGKTKSEALRATQMEMAADSQWGHPFYWAAWVLAGDWR